MKHATCEHCEMLRRYGECCQGIFCACRVAFRDAPIMATREEMLRDYERNRTNRLEQRDGRNDAKNRPGGKVNGTRADLRSLGGGRA